MAITVVQTNASGSWPANVTAGNSIIVLVGARDTSSNITGVSDSDSVSYTQSVQGSHSDYDSAHTSRAAIFHRHGITGGNKPTITVTAPGNDVNSVAVEASGLATAAPVATSTNGEDDGDGGGGASDPSTGGLTAADADTIVLAVFSAAATDLGDVDTANFSEPAGYTNRASGTVPSFRAATKVFSSALSGETPAWSRNESMRVYTWEAVAVAFKAASAGGGPLTEGLVGGALTHGRLVA